MPPASAQSFVTRSQASAPPVLQGLTAILGDASSRKINVDAASWFTERVTSHRDERLAVLIIEFDHVSLIQAAVEASSGAASDRLPKHLEEILPFGSYIERIGVDLFLALVGNFDSAGDLADMTNRMLGDIEDALPTPLSPRFGIAIYPDAGTDLSVLARRATIALTTAHDKSSNRVRVWSGSRSSPADNTYRLAADLGRALSQNEIDLNYQPKVSTTTGRVSGMEALVRWYHPRFGRIEPDEFIPIAEQNGLINQLGDWVLFTACRQLRYWQEEGLSPGTMAVNVSAHQVARGGFTETVSPAIRDNGIAPEDLTLELTESAVIRDDASAAEAIQELSARGVRFSVDEFGTGHATFSNLRNLAVDSVKIDRSFVSGMVHHGQDAVIVEAIFVMAERLGLSVIAEGVENMDQYRRLCELGCDEIQGFLFSTPLAEDQLAAFLSAHHHFTR